MHDSMIYDLSDCDVVQVAGGLSVRPLFSALGIAGDFIQVGQFLYDNWTLENFGNSLEDLA